MMADESHWQSKLHHLMREEEAPLPVKYLMDSEVDLLSKFIATHREQINLPTTKMFELDCWRYTDLVFLLILLRDNSVINIIDVKRTFVIEILRKLRLDKFVGSWFDSLESFIVDNVQNDKASLVKLEHQERKLRCENYVLRDRLEIFKEQLENFKAEHQITDLTSSEHVDMLYHHIKCLEQRSKELESNIANIMEQKEITSEARKSLNFFYPI